MDSGSLLTVGELGYYVEDLDNMALCLQRAWSGDLPRYRETLQKAARYVDDIHGGGPVAERWKETLEQLKSEVSGAP